MMGKRCGTVSKFKSFEAVIHTVIKLVLFLLNGLDPVLFSFKQT